MKVKCFGIAREIVGSRELELSGDSIGLVGDLRQYLNERYIDLNNMKSYMIAVNQEFATDDMKVRNDDEVAIIPPVSGG